MLTATVTVDLDVEDEIDYYDLDHSDRVRLDELTDVPDGVTVRVDVGARQLITSGAITWLRPHLYRLNIEIAASTPHIARRWLKAIRTGEI